MSTFQDLGLNDDLLRAITDLGFTEPSEVQEKAIPIFKGVGIHTFIVDKGINIFIGLTFSFIRQTFANFGSFDAFSIRQN